MRAGLFVGIVVLAAVVAAGQEAGQKDGPKTLEQLKPKLAELRWGMWSEERAEAVIGALLDNDRLYAAAWWLDAADDALAQKKLPGSARRSLFALRKRLLEKARVHHRDALKLSDALARHARDMVTKKNYEAAGEALAIAEQYLTYFPDRRARKQLERAKRKFAGVEKRYNYGLKDLLEQRQRTEALRSESTRILSEQWKDIVRDYQRYGHFRSYARVRSLVMAVCPKHEQARVLTGLRKVTLEFHEPETLKIWAIGSRELYVVVSGQQIGTQPSMWPGRPEESKTDETREWKPLTVRVLPGDVVAFRFEPVRTVGKDLGVLGRAFRGYVLVHARLEGKAVAKDGYRAMDPEAPGDLVPAQFGEIVDTPEPSRSIGGHVPRRSVRFSSGSLTGEHGGSYETSIVPLEDEIFAWFEKHGVEITCIRGTAEKPVPVLVVPGDGTAPAARG